MAKTSMAYPSDVLLNGTNANHELVKEGWWYQKYTPNDTDLEQLEEGARDAERIMADPAPIPPWVYRQARRGERLELPG